MRIFAVVMCLFFVMSCAKQTTTQRILPAQDRQIVVRSDGDTSSYVVEFPERRDREKFIDALENFISQYPFSAIQRDTIRDYIRIRVVPGTGEEPTMNSVPRAQVEETPLTPEQSQPTDTVNEVMPNYGGKVTVYSSRSFLDATLLDLVTPGPCRDSTPSPFFTIDPLPGRVRLSLSGKVTGGDGQTVSAFDLIDMWTNYIRKHPAEGRVLFQGVRGITEFIKGGEAVVPGIQASDQKSVLFQALKGSDITGGFRACPQRLILPEAKMGPYYIAATDAMGMTLQPNPTYVGGKPFLDKCTIYLTKENNPLLGFSLKKFDVVLLTSTRDLTYARERLLDSASLMEVAQDRYFLSTNGLTPAVRTTIAGLLKPQDILSHFVKAEGEAIGAVEEERAPGAPAPAPLTQVVAEKPISIVYRSDDPPSVKIAEKLMADLSRAGLTAQLKGLAETAYETALTNRDFALAVGWVPNRVLTDAVERQRLAGMWFGGEQDENRRIADGSEIPLFTVKTYALCKNTVGIYRSSLAGLFVKTPGTIR